LEFISVNYGLSSGDREIAYREDMKINDKSLLNGDISFLSCFRIVPEIFEALRGNKYDKETAIRYGFVEDCIKKITNEQIRDNPLLLEMINGNNDLLKRIADIKDLLKEP